MADRSGQGQRVDARPRVRRRLSGVVFSLTAANTLNMALGLITGPLLGRALGASGRGDLAAVQVPLALAPAILGFGISTFAYRELPRGRPLDEVIGSLGLPLLLVGLITAAAAVPIADALSAGRATVRTFLIVGFLTTPVVLVGVLLSACLAALEHWRAVIVANSTPFVVPFVAIVVMYLLHDLTVATASAVTITASLLGFVPGLILLWRARWPVFRLSVARIGVKFGLKSWVGGLALLANLRLDQLLMITLVAPRVLGQYAVATTISSVSGIAAGSLTPPLMARVAGGETNLLPQALRVTLAAALGVNLLLALLTPALLAVLFGPSFEGAVPMAILLLAASVPLAGSSVLSSGLQADGAPMIPSVGEGLAVVITVVGLLTLLKPLGGVGAALVSLVAYGTSFLYQLIMARRRLGVAMSHFLVPTRGDARWARALLAGARARLRIRPAGMA